MSDTLGKGAAVAITSADMAKLAGELGVHPADLEAIAEVESAGFGWFRDGRMKILFEKHIFYKRLPASKRTNAQKSGLARKSWISPAKGGYKDQSEPGDRYKLLDRAIRVDERAAFMSISMGKFQIMGFNHEVCGFVSARAMFNAFTESEVYQLRAFANFLKANGLVDAIKRGDFETVEKRYNGGGLNGAYAKKMRKAASKLRAGKWANWNGTQPAPQPQERPTPPPMPPKPAPAAPDASSRKGQGIAAVIIFAIAAVGSFFTGFWQWLLSLFGV